MRRRHAVASLLAVALVGGGLTALTALPAQAATKTVKAHENAPPLNVALTTAGQDGAVTFSGLSGQTVTVKTSAGTFAANCDVLVSLRNGAGTDLTTPVCGGTAVTLPAKALTANATYTVFLDTQGTATGSVKVAVTGTGQPSLTPGAPQITLTVPANSTVDWRFQLPANQFLFASFGTPSRSLDCDAHAEFQSPTGATLLSTSCLFPNAFLDRVVTASAGVHRLSLTNDTGTAFTVPVRLTSGKDTTAALTPGSATALKVATAGQQARYTFTGAVGQRPTLTFTGNTFAVAQTLQLSSPAGVVTDNETLSGGSGWVEFTQLQAAGTWTILIDPTGTSTGQTTGTLRLVTDQSTTITPGTNKTVTVATEAQNVSLTFTGEAGKKPALSVTGSTFDFAAAYLYRPDGSIRASGGFGSGATLVDWTASALDATGTWTLQIDPSARNTGSATLNLTLTSGGGGEGTLTPGTPVTPTVNAVGGTKSYTFNATAGQRATLDVATANWRSATAGNGPGSGYAVTYLYRPDGTYFGSIAGTSNTRVFGEQELDVSGLWTLTVDPNSDSKGSQTMTLGLVEDPITTITTGAATAVSIPTKGQNRVYTFTGTAGQRPTVAVSASSWASVISGGGAGSGYASAYLYRPDGSYFSSVVGTSQGAAYGQTSSLLDATGTWRLEVDPSTDSTGTATIALGLVTDQTTTITAGTAKTVTVGTRGQDVRMTFTGQVGKRATLAVSSASWTSSIAGGGPGSGYAIGYLYRPDGSYFTSLAGTSANPAYGESSEPLDASGTWTLVLDPSNDSVGSETMTLGQPTDLTGSITPGTAKSTSLTAKGQNATYTFSGTTGKRATMQVTAANLVSAVGGGGAGSGSASLYLYRPDGSYFGSLGSASSTPTYGEISTLLDANGTWTLQVDGSGDSTGTLTTKLSLVTDLTGTLVLNTNKTVTIGSPGQNALYTFSGTSGQQRGYSVTGNTLPNGTVMYLYRPDGSYFGSGYASPGASSGAFGTLDATGTWTLEVNPYQAETGSLTLKLTP